MSLMAKLMDIAFKRSEAVRSDGPTHDYTSRYWGHDFTINKVVDGGKELSAIGWGLGLQKGNYLILPQGSNSTRYQIVEVGYYFDPPDMWHARLKFAPRRAVA